MRNATLCLPVAPSLRRLSRGHWLLALAALVLPGCANDTTPPEPAAPEELPNILFVVLDTLRADHLGCYGYPRNTSPRIDAFAARATRYTRAQATAPWTLPTHASFFTGKYPTEHGAHWFMPPNRVEANANAYTLPDENLTLAEALGRLGYKSAGFVGNAAFCGPWTNIHQGFDNYLSWPRYAKELRGPIFNWIGKHRERPWFVFINFIDTHGPYNTTPRPEFMDPPATQERGLIKQFMNEVLPREKPVPQALRQTLIDQYDTSIANVDHEVGLLLQHLKRLRLYRKTLVIIVSDHGEYFGEHALVEHGKDVYEPAMRIAMLVKAPAQENGGVDDQRFSAAMLPRFIAEHLPERTGAKLREMFPPIDATEILAELHYANAIFLFNRPWGNRFHRERFVLYRDEYKYIHSSDGEHELYNLETDPEELDNLVGTQPERAAEMSRRLTAARAKLTPPAQRDSRPKTLTESERAVLESLGYLESTTQPGATTRPRSATQPAP